MISKKYVIMTVVKVYATLHHSFSAISLLLRRVIYKCVWKYILHIIYLTSTSVTAQPQNNSSQKNITYSKSSSLILPLNIALLYRMHGESISDYFLLVKNYEEEEVK